MKPISAFILAVLFFILNINLLSAQVNVQDSLALVDLYNSTEGTHWLNNSNWLTKSPASVWYGVSIKNSKVVKLDLAGNGLKGSITSSLGNLSNLKFLSLVSNYLTGSIPSTLGNLANIDTLNFNGNQLSGNIPYTLGNLSNLLYLGLGNNQLSGSIPSTLGNLSKLITLIFSGNQLSGSIPSTIGSLLNLHELYLDHNDLTGNIPASLGNLSNLVYLGVTTNKLSGTIPASLGNLFKLRFLFLDGNELSGAVPSSLGNLSNLIYLFLGFNKLSDSIPASLKNLASLTEFGLHNNNFTFAGMENIVQRYQYIIRYFSYAPQANIMVHQHSSGLSVSAGGTLSNNTYRWYKDGVLINTKTGDSTFIPAAIGNYYVSVTNSIASQLTLYSDTIFINVLPVNFLSFIASGKDRNILLEWSTAQEQNVSHFNIERSEDGKTFLTLAQIRAMGDNNNTSRYTYTDQTASKLNEGKLYYRLEEVDEDGSSQRSNIVTINLESPQVFTIYPNPAKEMLYVKTIGAITVFLVEQSGKILVKKHIIDYGEISIANIPPGLYYLKSNSNGLLQKVIIVAK